MCEEWQNDFKAFLAYIGPRPSKGYSLDRIDNGKGYEPGNVRWSDSKTQARNTRSNRIVEYQGEKMTVAEACEKIGIRDSLIHGRMHNGYGFETAAAMPLRKRGKKQWVEYQGEMVSVGQCWTAREAIRFRQGCFAPKAITGMAIRTGCFCHS